MDIDDATWNPRMEQMVMTNEEGGEHGENAADSEVMRAM